MRSTLVFITSVMGRFGSDSGTGFSFSAGALQPVTSANSTTIRKTGPRRISRDRYVDRICILTLVADHRGVVKAQHVVDGVGHCGAVAAGEQQAHGVGVGGHVFDHQRTGITAGQELAAFVGGDDLTGEGLGERAAAGALVLVGDAHGGVQAGNLGAPQAGGPAALLDTLAS